MSKCKNYASSTAPSEKPEEMAAASIEHSLSLSSNTFTLKKIKHSKKE
jgi:hypothetical protein